MAWLINPKEKLYPVGYDFKVKRKGRHLALSPGEAEKVAEFLSTLKDARITEGIRKVSVTSSGPSVFGRMCLRIIEK